MKNPEPHRGGESPYAEADLGYDTDNNPVDNSQNQSDGKFLGHNGPDIPDIETPGGQPAHDNG